MPDFVVSSFAASAFVGDAVLSIAFLGASSYDLGGLAVGPADPGRSGEAAAAGRAGPFVRAVETEAIAEEAGLASPGPEGVLAKSGVARMVAEMSGMVGVCHFPEADHRAATAESHFVHACLEAAPMNVAECVDLAEHCLPELPGPGPGLEPEPVAPVAAASRGIVAGVGNFAVGHAAFAAEGAPY